MPVCANSRAAAAKAASATQHPRALGPDHQEAIGEAIGEIARTHQAGQLPWRDRAAQADVRIAGIDPVRLGGGLEIDAIPAVAQRCRQRVRTTLAMALQAVDHVIS